MPLFGWCLNSFRDTSGVVVLSSVSPLPCANAGPLSITGQATALKNGDLNSMRASPMPERELTTTKPQEAPVIGAHEAHPSAFYVHKTITDRARLFFTR